MTGETYWTVAALVLGLFIVAGCIFEKGPEGVWEAAKTGLVIGLAWPVVLFVFAVAAVGCAFYLTCMAIFTGVIAARDALFTRSHGA